MYHLRGRALLWLGVIATYQTIANLNTEECEHGRQTSGANVRCQEGNNPDRQLRSQRRAMENEVGRLKQSGGWLVEAATFKESVIAH